MMSKNKSKNMLYVLSRRMVGIISQGLLAHLHTYSTQVAHEPTTHFRGYVCYVRCNSLLR